MYSLRLESALIKTSWRLHSVLPSDSTLWTSASIVCAFCRTSESDSGAAIKVFELGGFGKLKRHDFFLLQ